MKKMMKRLLAVLLAASIGLSACVQALAAPGNSPMQVSQVISGEGFREKMMKEYGDLNNAHYVLTSDLTFSSSSTAAMFCLGRPTNSWNEWKDKEGTHWILFIENN